MNKTRDEVKVFWVNGSGKAVQYGSVQPGKEMRFDTYAGHVWSVEGESGQKAVYRAVEGEGFIVVDFGTKLVRVFRSSFFFAFCEYFPCINACNIQPAELTLHPRSA